MKTISRLEPWGPWANGDPAAYQSFGTRPQELLTGRPAPHQRHDPSPRKSKRDGHRGGKEHQLRRTVASIRGDAEQSFDQIHRDPPACYVRRLRSAPAG